MGGGVQMVCAPPPPHKHPLTPNAPHTYAPYLPTPAHTHSRPAGDHNPHRPHRAEGRRSSRWRLPFLGNSHHNCLVYRAEL